MLTKVVEDGVVIVTLSNGKTNSITLETLNMLQDVVTEVNETKELKGIVLTGEGRFFSSGFDLPMFLGIKDHDGIVDFFAKEEEILTNFFTCDKPVVCAMNGHSAAMGIILSMASDYRIVKNHPKIKLGMSEIKIGLALSIAQSYVMRFGLDTDKKFRDVMYFGDMINPEKALETGMVDELVETDEELMKRAKEIVTSFIDTPGRPFINLKKLLRQDVADSIRKRLAEDNWQEPLKCFFDPEVRGTLEFVQAAMG